MRLLGQELFKLVRKSRTYLGFGVLSGVLIPVLLGFKYGSLERFLSLLAPNLDSWQMVGSPFNGLWVAWFSLDWLIRLVPAFVCLVGGDMIAGEAQAGTLRALLARPLSRTQLFWAKSVATFFYVVVLLSFVGAVSLGAGILMLGRGPLLLSQVLQDQGKFMMLAEGPALARLGLAFLLNMWGTFVVAALALLLSTLAEDALAPALGALGITIGCWILETMPFPWQEQIRPFLFTTHYDVWRELFATWYSDAIRWDVIYRGVGVSGLHIGGFLALGCFFFNRRDITS